MDGSLNIKPSVTIKQKLEKALDDSRSECTRTQNKGGQQDMFWAVLVGETEAENVRSITQLGERCMGT